MRPPRVTCSSKFEDKQSLNNNFLSILNKKEVLTMIVVPIKEGENIERALKKLKRKFEKTGVVKELRERQKFTKPSVINRERMQKAIYVQRLRQQELDK